MEKLDLNIDGSSMNIVEDNINKIRKLFPGVFIEDKVDFDKFKRLLGNYVNEEKDRYNFTWHGKVEAQKLSQKISTGTLRPCKEESKDWDSTDNIYIEGDNLEVLKLLQKSYHNKIKMIYIDPPYNTGKDFVYKDNFKDNLVNYLKLTGQVDEKGKKKNTSSDTSGRYHTNWLNMMYPRLKVARNLLKKDGVIFISIDDNEVHNLRKICDEVFGEDNFVADIIWQKKFSRANDATYFSTMHDHIICYCKNSKNINENGWEIGLIPRGDDVPDGYSNPDNDPRGVWTSVVLSAKSGSEKLLYKIETPSGRICEPPSGRYWSVNENKFRELVEDNRIWFGVNGDAKPRLKTFLSEVQNGLRPNTIWFHNEVGHNQEGKQETKALFDDKGVFDGPKPIRLINQLITVANLDKEDIILDFFSGSSSTAHAIMEKNVECDDKYKYIMIQLPEPTGVNSEAYKAGYKTISDIGKERIRRAGEKIKKENKDKEGIEDLDIGFKVFKLDTSNIKTWDVSIDDDLEQTLFDMQDNIKEDRKEEDIVYEILLKYGLDLTLPIEELSIKNKKVYVIGFGALVICLDQQITLDVVEEIGKLKEKYDTEIMRVVFKDTGFKDDVVKTNAIQILKKYEIDDVKSL